MLAWCLILIVMLHVACHAQVTSQRALEKSKLFADREKIFAVDRQQIQQASEDGFKSLSQGSKVQ